jgi:Bacterial Ig-like domain (group 3)/Divergent InlB B-repeat domain/Abnormal spindle-like microcephaly-assoc'd, ASPM-SPD-2-Hydin/Domain of unknown function DUF11
MFGCPRLYSVLSLITKQQHAQLKSRLVVSLLGAALALLGSAARAEAQCSGAGTTTYTSSGGVSVQGGHVSTSTNTITVPTLPAGSTITCVSVVLNGVTTDGQTYESMDYASFMLTAPSGQQFEFLGSTGDGTDGDDLNDAGSGLDDVNITVADNASQAAPEYPSIWPHTGSLTVKPGSYYLYPPANSQAQPPLPVGGNSTEWAHSDGTATFATQFETGATPSGGWILTLTDNDTIGDLGGDPVSVSSWSLVMTVAQTNNAGTNTSISSNPNPSFTGGANSTVTITADVTSSGGTPTGTVKFTDAGNTISGCGAVVLSSGVASCNTSFTTEGIHTLEASYSGGPGFNASNSLGLNQFVKNHSTLTSGEYCNTGAILENTSTVSPYPSVVNVGTDTTALTGTVAGVTVRLNGLSDSQGLGISDAFLLVAPDRSKAYDLDFMSDVGTSSSQSPVNVIFADNNPTAPIDGPLVSGTYQATDNYYLADTFPASQLPAPSVPSTINYAQPDVFGPNPFTFSQAFGGANGNGDWSLFAINNTGTVINLTGGWCLSFTVNNGVSTTTALAPSANPSSTGTSVTLTATVTSGGNPVTSGTVTFTENGVAPAGVSNNTVSLNGGGQASISTTALTEGDHNILATYNGVANTYDPSSNSVWQRVNTPTTTSGAGTNANPAVYCNPGGITLPTQVQNFYDVGPAAPNPSNIVVSNLPGTINSVALELQNFQTNPIADTILWTSSLLVGPGATSANSIDFFTGTGTTDNDTFLALGNYIFADGAPGLVPQTNYGPGGYQPTSYQNGQIKGSYVPSPSGFYTLPGSWEYAAPRGSSSFGSLYDGTNPNGIWSLYFYQNTSVDNPQASAAAWCLSFIENLPVLAISKSHSGNFAQGQTGAQYTVSVTNNGPGSTAGTVTVTENPPTGLTVTGMSGNNWSCAGSTCTRSDALAQSASYDPITVTVNVSPSAGSSLTNSVSVSGGGTASTVSANDITTITAAPFLSITKTHTGTFTQGQTAEWDLNVSNESPGSTTSGTVTVQDTLPANYTIANFGSTLYWSCLGIGTGSASCTTTQAVTGGQSFSTIKVIVNVPPASPKSVTNNAVAWGGGDLNHTNSGNGATTFETLNVVQVPASISINGSGTQSANVNTAFGSLAVTVTDAGNVAIASTPVTFTATTGGSGQSGTFSNNTGTTTVSTNPSGVADPGTFTANSKAGSYTVGVSAGSATTTFNLTNNLQQYQLTIAANPSNGGTVTPTSGSTYGAGTVVPITATAAAGYVFVNWTSSPDSVANSTSPSTSITMNAAESVAANFQPYATAVPTSTALVSSQNPSFTSPPSNSVMFTASVTYNNGANPVGPYGSITFTDAGNPVAGGPSGPVALDANGKASFTTTSLSEGTHDIQAAYSGYNSLSASYLTSSGTVGQEVDNHTVVTGDQFCNPGPIAVPNSSGAATPYPSRIFVSGLSGDLGKLTVTLNNISSSDIPLTDLLLVGPTGAKIIPFASVGDGSTISGVNVTLDDAASGLIPGGSPLTTGTYKPTSITGGTSLVFPAPAPLINSSNYAATDGAATLSSAFEGTAPNGTWELFTKANGASGAASIGGGWCVTVTAGTAPAITSANYTAFPLGRAGTFTVTATGSPTPSLGESGTLPMGVTFVDNHDGTGTLSGTPTQAGGFPIMFTASNGVGSPAVQNFSLTTSGPFVTVGPSSVNFGNVYLTATQPETVTVSNVGTAAVTISNVTVTPSAGTTKAEFKATTTCTTLAVGHTCPITVTFDATAVGTPSATLNVTDTGGGSPQHVGLSATVIDPKGQFSAGTLGFTTVKVGSTRVKTLTFKNSGKTTLDISGIGVTGADPNDFTQTNNCPSSLTAGSNCEFTVTFAPKATGARSATLTVSDNAANGSQSVTLSGKGQ